MNILQQTWRDGVVSRALAYTNFTWMADERHILHGYDTDGVLVHTPDTGYKSTVYDCGWFQVGNMNQGVPYSWGGASSLSDFENGLAMGNYAGNVPDSRDNGVSRHCVGVDCSGLITACWGLEKKLSTKTIPLAATPLSSLNLLLPGDVILSSRHVLIFVEFSDSKKTAAKIVDASRRTGKALQRTIKVSELPAAGYVGYRKNM